MIDRWKTAVIALLCLVLGAGGGWLARGKWAPRIERVSAVPPITIEDTNGDGRPERWIQRAENGATQWIGTDRNHDGKRDRVEHYGAGGRVVRVDYDEDYDGGFDRYDTVTREGYAILTHYDRDWDDQPERWVQRGGRGEVVSEWIDADENTAPERYREFGSNGRLLEEGIDEDGDGLYEQQLAFNPHWPGRGPQVRERDDDRDGSFERRELYDENGVLFSVQLDTDGDGQRDLFRYLRPDGTVSKEGRDRNGNGDIEEWRYVISERENRIAHDDDGDQDIDRWDPPGPPNGWCEARCMVRRP